MLIRAGHGSRVYSANVCPQDGALVHSFRSLRRILESGRLAARPRRRLGCKTLRLPIIGYCSPVVTPFSDLLDDITGCAGKDELFEQ